MVQPFQETSCSVEEHSHVRPEAGRFFFVRGRVALYAALQALGIGDGDEVILPGFTCIVVPNAIRYLGAKPVYADIDRETYNIDPSCLEDRISERTKAVIVQHTFGIPAEMDRIRQVAGEHALYLIEDCAHTVHSTYKGKVVGSFGDVAFYSSQWSKPVTTGLGGWAVVNKPELMLKMEALHAGMKDVSWGQVLQLRLQYFAFQKLLRPSIYWRVMGTYRWLTGMGLTIGSARREETEGFMPSDYARKMSRWQRTLLVKNLERIKKTGAHRRWVCALYEDALRKQGRRTLQVPPYCDAVLLRYPVLVKDKPGVLARAKAARIEIGDWFVSPIHPRLDRWEVAGYRAGMCPVAEEVASHVINLPTHERIRAREVRRIMDFLDAQSGV